MTARGSSGGPGRRSRRQCSRTGPLRFNAGRDQGGSDAIQKDVQEADRAAADPGQRPDSMGRPVRLRERQLLQPLLPGALPVASLPAALASLHGEAAVHQVQVPVPAANVLSVRASQLRLLPAMLDSLALAAGLVALPGAAARQLHPGSAATRARRRHHADAIATLRHAARTVMANAYRAFVAARLVPRCRIKTAITRCGGTPVSPH